MEQRRKNMNKEKMIEIAANIIFSHEGNYGSVNRDDNGAISVGKVQWHGSRALNLMRTICNAMGASQSTSILGAALYTEITANATSWANRKATEAEAARISQALCTEEGKKAQDALALADITEYCTHIKNLGVTDPAAIIFMADIENQGGAGASARIIKAASGKNLDALYASAKVDRVFKNYMARRDTVYAEVKQYEETKEGTQMAVLIGHASIDENGTIQGKTAGDQTGKEICTRSWYSKPWNVYLECLDDTLAEKAATFMEQICADANFGYSQPNRWKGYNSIINNGRKVAGAKGDFDCSSLVLSCYILAGLSIAATGYTGNMKSILVGTGKFKAYTDSAHLTSDAYAKRGGIYLKESSHVVMALSNGSKASVSSSGSSGSTSSSEGNKIYVGKGIGTATAKTNMNVRDAGSTSGKSIGGVTKGASVEVLEKLSNGWYKIVWPGAFCGYAYTSNASGKYYTYVANGTVGSGNTSLKAVGAKSKDVSLAGKYTTTANLNMRAKPGVLKDDNIITVLKKGASVQNYGFYTMVNGVKWLLVAYGDLVGFCSMEYLKK